MTISDASEAARDCRRRSVSLRFRRRIRGTLRTTVGHCIAASCDLRYFSAICWRSSAGLFPIPFKLGSWFRSPSSHESESSVSQYPSSTSRMVSTWPASLASFSSDSLDASLGIATEVSCIRLYVLSRGCTGGFTLDVRAGRLLICRSASSNS